MQKHPRIEQNLSFYQIIEQTRRYIPNKFHPANFIFSYARLNLLSGWDFDLI
jgi:hypothetical protein